MAIVFGKYQIELANKIVGGRCVGNQWVVTRRPMHNTTIVARFETREEAETWAAAEAAKGEL